MRNRILRTETEGFIYSRIRLSYGRRWNYIIDLKAFNVDLWGTKLLQSLKNRDQIINQMFSYLEDEHRNNIHKQAFTDIANVFLDLIDEYSEQFDQYIKINKNETNEDDAIINKIKWVCNASPGHGKTTVLICWLKWLVLENRPKWRIPVLLVIRENKMAEEIFSELKAFDEKCIVIVNSENKEEVEPYVSYHQIVIITHARLDNLSMGYGNKNIYRIWEQYNLWWTNENQILNPDNLICKRQRLLIIDEKPSFTNSSIFNIGSKNNSLDWFDDLSGVLKLSPYQSQDCKSQIINLIADHLWENSSDITTALLPREKTVRMKNLLDVIKKIKKAEETKSKIESLKKLKHFENLLKSDGIGRIDDYEIRRNSGRKIIIAERINYEKMDLNIVVLDGTAEVNKRQYSGFKLKKANNYNDYSRVFMCQDVINTSKYSRLKSGSTTQKAISERIKELKEKHDDLFVLPMKSDIGIYISLGAIEDKEKTFFEEKATENSKPINLLNTSNYSAS